MSWENAERRERTNRWEERLGAAADDRLAVAGSWLRERANNAEVIAGYPPVRALLQTGAKPARALAQSQIQGLIDHSARVYGYTHIRILDRDGHQVGASSGGGEADSFEIEAARAALTAGRTLLIDFHRDKGGVLLLGYAAPVAAGPGATPAGTVVTAIRPEVSLFPLLSNPLIERRTDETLLARRSGAGAEVFSSTATAAGVPLAPPRGAFSAELTEALHAGKSRFGSFADPGAPPFFAALRIIPATGWGLVVKIDRAEALNPLRTRRRMVIATALGFYLAVVGVGLAVLRRTGHRHALAEAWARLAAIVESSNDAILSTDLEERITSWNPGAEKMYGYAPEEVIGRSPTFLAPPGWGDEVSRAFERLRAGASRFARYEAERVKKDGDSIRVEVTLSRIENERGDLLGFASITRDMTEKRAAAEALRESEAQFRGAFDHAPIGIALLNTEGRWLKVNRSLCEMLGYSENELLGRRFTDLTHEEDVAGDVALLGRLLSGELKTVEREKRYTHKDGHTVQVLVHVSPVRNEAGSLAHLIVQYLDVTHSRRAEEQLLQAQKMEAIGLLAGGVAHDFNNIMTAITGYSELLLGNLPPDDPRREYAEQIRKSGDRAASLTRQLLAFSRRQVLQPRVLDLSSLVSGMRGMLQRLIGETIEVVTSTPADLWPVRADPSQIEQAVLDLVVNARDAMPDGGTLSIVTRNAAIRAGDEPPGLPMPPGDYAVLAISDTGTGMSPEVLAHLFEPFFTTKEQGRGTGLGLSTTYGIVKQSGGFISCDSEPGRGTAFEIFLPRVAAEVARAAGPAAAPAQASGRERLLLVEDEPEVRALFQKVLTMLGYEVLSAPGPAEAIHLAATSEPIALMVTDVVMPGMSGRQLADRLAETRPEMKVLFVSGYTDDAIARHGVLEPGTAFLQKPFTPRALGEKVREVLGADGPNVKIV